MGKCVSRHNTMVNHSQGFEVLVSCFCRGFCFLDDHAVVAVQGLRCSFGSVCYVHLVMSSLVRVVYICDFLFWTDVLTYEYSLKKLRVIA